MASKVIEILGVVDEGGGGGAAYSPYYRDVQFSKWRQVGGDICGTKLYVREPCKEVEIRPWMKSIKAGTMLHMEIRFTKQMASDQLRGKVIRYFGKTRSDKELLNAAKDKRPTSIDIPGFATFKLDRRHDCYSTTVVLGNKKVCIDVQSDRHKTIADICKQVEDVDFLKPAYQQRLSQALERDLLPLKNSAWLDDNEKPLNGAQFRKALKLSAIEIAANGKYECIFDDGELFGGHDLVVRGNLKSGPKDADLHG